MHEKGKIKSKDTTMKIEILGMGCPKCKQLEANVRKAAEALNIKVNIVKVTELDKIVDYGVMSTPALVIDGKVKSYGRIAEVDEIETFIK